MSRRQGKEYVDLDGSEGGMPSLRAQLRAERTRTRIASYALMRFADSPPAGLSARIIATWLQHATKGRAPARTARQDHVAYVLDLWRAQPTKAPMATGRERPLSEATLQALRDHRRRTRISPAALLRGRSDVPGGLTSGTVALWLRGVLRKAEPGHIEYVLRLWSEAPSVVPMTGAIRRKLCEARDSSGGSVPALVRSVSTLPAGLSEPVIHALLSGKRQWVRPDHLEFLLGAWQELARASREKLRLTHDMVVALRQEIGRTGVTPARVFEGATAIPEGLTPEIIESWRKKSVYVAQRGDWSWTLERYRALPDLPQGFAVPKLTRHNPNHRPFSEKERALLRSHNKRTGVGGRGLLSGATDRPPGLTDGMIASWLCGRTKMVDPAHLRYVLKRYAALPDRQS